MRFEGNEAGEFAGLGQLSGVPVAGGGSRNHQHDAGESVEALPASLAGPKWVKQPNQLVSPAQSPGISLSHHSGTRTCRGYVLPPF